MMNSFYTYDELKEIGFQSIGQNVFISRKTSIYSPSKISIGNNVRIDDFCILSGNITIGDYVHISAYSALYGSNGIILEGYCGISPRCVILSSTDNFSGDFFIGAQFPSEYRNVKGGTVIMKKFSQLATTTVVFPNIRIEEGAVTGAMTLVNKDLAPWTINIGIPVNKSIQRKKGLLNMVKFIDNSEILWGGVQKYSKILWLHPICA